MDILCASSPGYSIYRSLLSFFFSVTSELKVISLRWIFMIFYSLFCQVMIFIAWNGLDSPLDLLDPQTFEDLLTIFITNAVLRLVEG